VVSTSAQRSRRREQRENTRREILVAADRFLRERPYRDLSVDLLMAQTDLTRTAFYRHFDDVSQLVLRLLEELGSDLYAIAESWRSSAGHDYPTAARRALSAAVDFFAAHGPLVRAIAEAAATDDQIERGYRRFVEAFTEMTQQALDELVARGQIEPLDTAALARALNLMNEAYLLAEFGREPQGDPEIALATLETVWVRAVGPLKPVREE
jgi:TetR/AcrR family transcriptional regulator, ethionamide resistance regulator